MVCKGVCEQYKSTIKRYLNGKNKRCTTCSIFMLVSGVNCPCCNTKLRTRNRLYGERRNG
jgi:hypothetical protein